MPRYNTFQKYCSIFEIDAFCSPGYPEATAASSMHVSIVRLCLYASHVAGAHIFFDMSMFCFVVAPLSSQTLRQKMYMIYDCILTQTEPKNNVERNTEILCAKNSSSNAKILSYKYFTSPELNFLLTDVLLAECA